MGSYLLAVEWNTKSVSLAKKKKDVSNNREWWLHQYDWVNSKPTKFDPSQLTTEITHCISGVWDSNITSLRDGTKTLVNEAGSLMPFLSRTPLPPSGQFGITISLQEIKKMCIAKFEKRYYHSFHDHFI